jgi:hypothetical protein
MPDRTHGKKRFSDGFAPARLTLVETRATIFSRLL